MTAFIDVTARLHNDEARYLAEVLRHASDKDSKEPLYGFIDVLEKQITDNLDREGYSFEAKYECEESQDSGK